MHILKLHYTYNTHIVYLRVSGIKRKEIYELGLVVLWLTKLKTKPKSQPQQDRNSVLHVRGWHGRTLGRGRGNCFSMADSNPGIPHQCECIDSEVRTENEVLELTPSHLLLSPLVTLCHSPPMTDFVCLSFVARPSSPQPSKENHIVLVSALDHSVTWLRFCLRPGSFWSHTSPCTHCTLDLWLIQDVLCLCSCQKKRWFCWPESALLR